MFTYCLAGKLEIPVEVIDCYSFAGDNMVKTGGE